MMMIFENTLGKLVNFEERLSNCVPQNNGGTLFHRNSKDDFYFKVNIVFKYFRTHKYSVLRHKHFQELVTEARGLEVKERVAKKLEEDRELEEKRAQEKERLETVRLAELDKIVKDVLQVLRKDYININPNK